MIQEGINLIDIRRFKYGTSEWRNAMIHNIRVKIEAQEELGSLELCFIEIELGRGVKSGI